MKGIETMKTVYDIKALVKDVPADKEYYTVNELIQITGIQRLTILKRIEDGTLTAKKIGGVWRVHADNFR